MKLFLCILVFSFLFLLALSESVRSAVSEQTPTNGTSVDPTTPSDGDDVKLVLVVIKRLLEGNEKVNFLNSLIQKLEELKSESEEVKLPKSDPEPSPSSPNTTNTTATTSSTDPTTNQTTPTNASTPEITVTTEATTQLNNYSIDTPKPEPGTEISVNTDPAKANEQSPDATRHFYQSTVFFFLIFSSIVTVFALYFGYMSRRKIKVYIYKKFGIRRNGKPYARVPTLEDAMPSFADVKN